MATIAPISIQNGAAVATTFNPVGRATSTEGVRYRLSTGPVLLASRLETEISSRRDVDRVTGKITIPKFNTPADGSAPTLQYTCIGSFDFSLPSAATEAERKDVRVLLANLIANSQVVDMTDKGGHQIS